MHKAADPIIMLVQMRNRCTPATLQACSGDLFGMPSQV